MIDLPTRHEAVEDLFRDANPYWGLLEVIEASGDEERLRDLLHERRAREARSVGPESGEADG